MQKMFISLFVILLIALSVLGFMAYSNQETINDLKTANVQLKSEKFTGRSIPLISEEMVLTKTFNEEALANLIAQSTFELIYSIGSDYVRKGKVVILGKEGDYYIGFTTACTLLQDSPWKIDIGSEQKYNEVVIIKNPHGEYEWFQVGKSSIVPEKPVAAVRYLSEDEICGEGRKTTLRVDATKGWQSNDDLNVNELDAIVANAYGEWNPGERMCGPEGLTGWFDPSLGIGGGKTEPKGSLIAYRQGTKKAGPIVVVGKNRRYFALEKGQWKFSICDGDSSDNSGFVTVNAEVIPSPASQLRKLKQSTNIVEVKRIPDNDICLILFPINSSNSFSGGDIQSLGLEDPINKVIGIVQKSTNLFGFKFFLYCENCKREIDNVPEKLREAYSKGFEEGKQYLAREVTKHVVAIAVSFVTSGLADIDFGLGKRIAHNIFHTVIDKMWESQVKRTIEETIPVTKGLLPEKLGDLLPKEFTEQEYTGFEDGHFVFKDGEKISLAGIIPVEDERIKGQIAKFLQPLISKAERLLVVPDKESSSGSKSGHVTYDGKYLNQLLVASGLAKVDRRKREFPFYQELMETEEVARNQQLGIWGE